MRQYCWACGRPLVMILTAHGMRTSCGNSACRDCLPTMPPPAQPPISPDLVNRQPRPVRLHVGACVAQRLTPNQIRDSVRYHFGVSLC